MQPFYNKIIFQPYYGLENFVVGDVTLKVDTSYDPGKHLPVTGLILAICDHLVYGEDDTQQYDVPLEVSPGMEAIIDFQVLFDALDLDHTIEILGTQCVFVRYDSLLVARNASGMIVPLNGYVLGSALTPQDLSEFENIHRRKYPHDTRLAKIEHVGVRVKDYFWTQEKDEFDPSIGDVVVLDDYCDLPIENEGRYQFFDKKMFYFHRKNIIGKVN